MNLAPHEILKYLGFDVPAEGVNINPADAFLVTSTLQLLGATMDADRVPDKELRQLHHGMAGLVSMWSAAGQIAPLSVPQGEPNDDSLLKLRATLNVLLTTMFKRR